ncbi:GlxA family transcriptional regulator [Kushneria aurantia]|uniref:GlxA family transcriptional regulator n=1 Tax=Kushneria aurantia TaxID=504092 RepID=A0ABV6G0M0_9GAMM|nr:GlxA family transcriptional regulator [Kushneria aurantia]
MPIPDPAERHITFLLIERFSMMAFFSAVEPLRIANRIAAASLYGWTLASIDGTPVTASNQMRLMVDAAAGSGETPTALALCAGFAPLPTLPHRLVRWLYRLDRAGCRLGGIDTGAFLLAEAGLISADDHVTLHWESLPAFRERWPHLQAGEALYELGERRFFCAGGAAAMDMSLAAIARHHGEALAHAVAEQLIHDRLRSQDDQQRLSIARRLNLHDRPLVDTIALMERHIEQPLPLDTLAQRASISRRQQQRLFAERLNSTPGAWYLALRLAHARGLLAEGTMNITDIALACGFTSTAAFSHAFRRQHDISPRDFRRQQHPDTSKAPR